MIGCGISKKNIAVGGRQLKVFLSHSSKDKHIVSAVANRLGRSYIVYDDFTFDTAVDFETSIERGLEVSELFVLFASRNSIQSDWVQKELTQAQALRLAGKIDSIAAIIIDDLPIDELPDWLKKARVVSLNSVASITREIQYLFQRRLSQKQSPYFVGRQSEIEEAEAVLSPTSSLDEPHVFSFFGLEGVGRKTLCRHVCANLLSLPKSQTFRIQDGDSLADLVIKIEEDINPSPSIAATKSRISTLEKTSSRDLSVIFERLAKAFVDARELLILQDDGGLLDNDGFVKSEFADMIAIARNSEAIRFAIVSRRKVRFAPPEKGFPCISVGPLKEDDAKRLILRQFRGSKFAITDQQANELAPYVGG
ncbi:TIR domain-containing protein [Bradyrhizobium macuxiense]|uniref:TIR domain-containing protein n=1 Tax=Bradyrhizobium macuxiense TaxID=1755647 RepID=A0A560M3Q9_9BRAD|nr:toll/interleukin-1 receptor domain-containing protein [Bradyrhizobium macuxiense]TWC00311.1 TIR domain-containing protein [Bradyrhizobium macuxiense]